MGDVAASGGYLAAVRADVIVAEPATITGSIGVFGIWPVASELLDTLGVKFERLSTGGNAGMYSTYQPPTEAQKAAINKRARPDLRRFHAPGRRGAQARPAPRSMPPRAAACFSGVDAKQAGLVDELGGLQLALQIAKAKAGIDEAPADPRAPLPARERPLAEARRSRDAARWRRFARADAQGAARAARCAGAIRHCRRPGNVRLPPLPPLWH